MTDAVDSASGPIPAPGSPFSPLVTVECTGSTNDDLRIALAGPDGFADPGAAVDWPHLSALHALAQTAGRGRGGHVWVTPPTGALTISTILRPLVPPERLDWLPLLAGLVVERTIAPRLEGTGWRARTKWPNDVVIARDDAPDASDAPARPADVPGWEDTRKVAGVLCELVPALAADGSGAAGPAPQAPPAAQAAPGPADERERRSRVSAVIVGFGVNIDQSAEQLPVPWATSLALLGADREARDMDGIVADLGRHLTDLVGRWEALGGDPGAGDGSLGRELRDVCSTLGRALVVDTPAGKVRGTAVGMEPGLVLDGAALVEPRDGSPAGAPAGRIVVSAGDVSLVRRVGED